MSNIYNIWKQFLEIFIYSLFDIKVYPFEFMDDMYSSDLDVVKKEKMKRIIIQKISDFLPLEKEDHDFLATLSSSEIMQFIRAFNANIEALSEYINYKL